MCFAFVLCAMVFTDWSYWFNLAKNSHNIYYANFISKIKLQTNFFCRKVYLLIWNVGSGFWWISLCNFFFSMFFISARCELSFHRNKMHQDFIICNNIFFMFSVPQHAFRIRNVYYGQLIILLQQCQISGQQSYWQFTTCLTKVILVTQNRNRWNKKIHNY